MIVYLPEVIVTALGTDGREPSESQSITDELVIQEEKIKCHICDFKNHNFSSQCSECGINLRKKKAKMQSKKKNKKKIERKQQKKKQRQCQGNKVTYRSKLYAKKAREKLLHKKGRGSRIYRCHTCKGYHLTKQKN